MTTQWQKNRDHMLAQEAAGTATTGMMEWLSKWRDLGSPSDKSGMANEGLTFGASGGTSIGNTWDNSDVTNPGGITGVVDNNTGVGFSGSKDHFITHTPSGEPLSAETGPVGGNSAPSAPANPYVPAEVEAATPFLDSYIRAREAADAEGPVTKMFKEWME